MVSSVTMSVPSCSVMNYSNLVAALRSKCVFVPHMSYYFGCKGYVFQVISKPTAVRNHCHYLHQRSSNYSTCRDSKSQTCFKAHVDNKSVPTYPYQCVKFSHLISSGSRLHQRQSLQAVPLRDFSTFPTDGVKSSAGLLEGEIDRYKGIWVDLSQQEHIDQDHFEAMLEESFTAWRHQGLQIAWLKVDMSQGSSISVAAKYGFLFHHAEGQLATMVAGLEVSAENRVPRFATHQIGVSGVVINEETNEILVVQDKGRSYTLWKFPGGLSDLGEDVAQTAEREVYEETGLKTEFQSILAFRQQHDQPGAFGRSDMYILCRLKPLTFELNPCAEEIAACQWMTVEQLRKEIQASSLTHRVVNLVEAGLTKGWKHVDIRSERMESIHKGKIFDLFHRPLMT